jgi:hypothetical protein
VNPGSHQVTVYLAVDIPPDVVPGDLAAIQRELADAARQIAATGRPVRYLNGMYMPGQARLLCAFAAESAEAVHEAARGVRWPFTEIKAAADQWKRWPPSPAEGGEPAR